ncbi:MAG: prolipoprotein diacylglyceryl transferase [Chloroflexi bacterium]|nr:prolipoprotein diacylglyceryl transferase [Chloroflexota bacterium]MDA1272298.1 prolipoprotein diacylglyceryl transferase [Chloroflexota bacterium]PKB59158.1 MAG: prolipoprotein diacylglyceryl transferase [SAR202 cluster bacterium Casp-Chloro-G2]
MGALASISIGINPNLIDVGPFVLSWHGVMTFVAVAVAVYLVAKWGGREGMNVDSIYSVAVWAIIGGVIGARVLHVIDFWNEVYRDDFWSVFSVWSGGIAIYGAIIGGFIGGALYIMIRNSNWFLALWGTVFPFMGDPHPANLPGIGRLADITAPALLIGQAIGRVGDVINGEHFSTLSNLPWAVIYTHPNSPGIFRPPTHPAVAYELLFDLLLLVAIWPLRDRLRPHGMFFALYLGTYSIGRFFLSFLREEFNEYFGALNEAQVVAIIVVLLTVPLLVWKAQLVRPTVNRN